jgi:serine/threonine-protein kinase
VGSYLPAGTVAEQNPAGGSQTIDGATVQLGVSNGVAPVSVVPKVKGMSVGEATAALRAAHFLVNAVERAVTDPALEGIVWNQSPAGGASLAEGSTVTIFVGVLQAGGGNGGGGGAGGGNGGGG